MRAGAESNGVPSAGYEKSISDHGTISSHQFCGWAGSISRCTRAAPLPRTRELTRRPPLFPRQLHLLAASNRAWHPFGGGGLRFILLPLTF